MRLANGARLYYILTTQLFDETCSQNIEQRRRYEPDQISQRPPSLTRSIHSIQREIIVFFLDLT